MNNLHFYSSWLKLIISRRWGLLKHYDGSVTITLFHPYDSYLLAVLCPLWNFTRKDDMMLQCDVRLLGVCGIM